VLETARLQKARESNRFKNAVDFLMRRVPSGGLSVTYAIAADLKDGLSRATAAAPWLVMAQKAVCSSKSPRGCASKITRG